MEVGEMQRLIPRTFSIPCPATFTMGWSLPGINPSLPARLTGKQDCNKEGMERGRGRKGAREGVYSPFTVPQTSPTMSKRFNSMTVVAGIVICFCSVFVEIPRGMPTTTACPVLWWEAMFSSPDCVPYHKQKSLLEVSRETILKFPDSEILKTQVWGGHQTPTSCAFPQTLPSLVEHYTKLPLCPKPLQTLALFSLSTWPRASSFLSMILQTSFCGLELHQALPLSASMLLPLHCLPLPLCAPTTH